VSIQYSITKYKVEYGDEAVLRATQAVIEDKIHSKNKIYYYGFKTTLEKI
jgi:hypothetical protein